MGRRNLVFVDLVYGKWTAINNKDWSASFTVGKMENRLFFRTWFSTGIYAEGFSQQLTFNAAEAHQLKLNLGEFFLDEISTESEDPFMFGAAPPGLGLEQSDCDEPGGQQCSLS
jgi:hypothetical protein